MTESLYLTAVLTPDSEGGYSVRIAELPGAISQGDTVEEALANVCEAAELYLEYATPEERLAISAHPITTPVQVNIA
jgi:predicted RNase H-like HicB family nuclease